MPEPTNPYSTDYYLYKHFFNPISKKLCFIHPNIITLSSLFFVKPLINNIVLKKSIKGFLTIGFLKYIIDCFDGSVARKCNKTSYFGSILDFSIDSIFWNISGYFLYKKLLELASNKFQKIIIHLVYIYCIIANIKRIYFRIMNKTENNEEINIEFKIRKFYHDNMLIVDLIKNYLIKKILLL